MDYTHNGFMPPNKPRQINKPLWTMILIVTAAIIICGVDVVLLILKDYEVML